MLRSVDGGFLSFQTRMFLLPFNYLVAGCYFDPYLNRLEIPGLEGLFLKTKMDTGHILVGPLHCWALVIGPSRCWACSVRFFVCLISQRFFCTCTLTFRSKKKDKTCTLTSLPEAAATTRPGWWRPGSDEAAIWAGVGGGLVSSAAALVLDAQDRASLIRWSH